MKKLLLKTTLLPFALIAFSTTALAGEDITGTVSVDYASEYVFRGVSYQRGTVQPGIELGKDGFTLGVWSSVAVGEVSAAAIDEIDVYGGYSWSLSDMVDTSVGFTLYHFPDTPGGLFDLGGASTFEVNAGVALNTVLAPTLTGYYDFDLEAFTVEGGVSQSIPLAEKTSLDLGLTAAFVTADGGGDYQYGLASASVGYGVTDNASAYIGANYSLSSENTLRFKVDGNGNGFTNSDNLLWFGVGFAAGF